MKSTPRAQQDAVRDQFARLAAVYAEGQAINNEQALQLLVAGSGAGPEDSTLDVACGAGQVVCAFARVVRNAAGIDLVPEMIEKGRALQAGQALTNVEWHTGDVAALPFAEGAYTIVTSRIRIADKPNTSH